jgi:hypothetical protein
MLGTFSVSSAQMCQVKDIGHAVKVDYLLKVVVCLVFHVLGEQRLGGNGGETGDGDPLRNGGESGYLSGNLRRHVWRCSRQHAQQNGPGFCREGDPAGLGALGKRGSRQFGVQEFQCGLNRQQARGLHQN